MAKEKEFTPTHRLVDKDGIEVGEEVMLFQGLYYMESDWNLGEKGATAQFFRDMGWWIISSFRE